MDEAKRRRCSNNIVTDAGRLNLLVPRLLDLARRKSRASSESRSIGAGLALLQAQDRPALRVEAGGETGLRMSGENAAICSPISSTIRRGMAPRWFQSQRRRGRQGHCPGERRGRRYFAQQPDRHFPSHLHHTTRFRRHRHACLGIVLALLRAHGGMNRLVERATRFEIIVPVI
ncbi:hypothetical protein [Mesorhizobium sp. WSM3862]|uniref:hypothetical protein n=1 Tax=Mesorhizobium sp. WSM3862 TaxID=632858 RepID=UPI001596E650